MSLLPTRLHLFHCWAPNALPNLKPTFAVPRMECLLCACPGYPCLSQDWHQASGYIIRQFGSLAPSKETKPLNPVYSCLFERLMLYFTPKINKKVIGLRVFHDLDAEETGLGRRPLFGSLCLQWKWGAGRIRSLSPDNNLCSGFSILWLLGTKVCLGTRREN